MTLATNWLVGDLSFTWQALAVMLAVVILILTVIVTIDLVQLFRAQPVNQLYPDGAIEREIAVTPEIPYLLGSTPIYPSDVHVPSVKPLDRSNYAASHSATVTDIASKRKVG